VFKSKEAAVGIEPTKKQAEERGKRQIKVKVRRPSPVVRARDSYIPAR
jgi:hypothetical protein